MERNAKGQFFKGGYWTGKKRGPHTAEHRKKISLSMKGIVHREESRLKMSESKIGTHLSEAHKANLSKALAKSQAGRRGNAWIEDRTLLKKSGDSEKDRRSSAYVTWRKEVWSRDSFKCKIGNEECSGRIEAHHILSWREHIDLRYEINNGITLCHFHHPRKREHEKQLSPYFQELVGIVENL